MPRHMSVRLASAEHSAHIGDAAHTPPLHIDMCIDMCADLFARGRMCAHADGPAFVRACLHSCVRACVRARLFSCMCFRVCVSHCVWVCTCPCVRAHACPCECAPCMRRCTPPSCKCLHTCPHQSMPQRVARRTPSPVQAVTFPPHPKFGSVPSAPMPSAALPAIHTIPPRVPTPPPFRPCACVAANAHARAWAALSRARTCAALGGLDAQTCATSELV